MKKLSLMFTLAALAPLMPHAATAFTASTAYHAPQANTLGTQVASNVRISTAHFTTGYGNGIPNELYGSYEAG